MAKYVFGIDLGTTYSCIAYVDDTNRPTVIPNMENTKTTPSVVNFSDDNTVVVGQVAKENAVLEPENTISLVKTLMGRQKFAIRYNDEDLSPEVVSSYILRKLVRDAEQNLNLEIKDVVITCPAYFGSAEREATKNAGIIAGLNVIEVINEPTAAALYYGCSKAEDEKTFLVYDLGGGTFDVTVMRIAEGKVEELCSFGDHDLGGKDWDAAVMSYLKSQFEEETGEEFDDNEFGRQDLALKAETAKQQLTQREEAKQVLDSAGTRGRVSITRETFNAITADLLTQTLDKTDEAIAATKAKGYSIDEILLVGGSTKMPQVREALMEKYAIETKVLEPDEAVAKGAAIYAVGAYEVNFQMWQEKIASGEVDLSNAEVKEEVEKYQEEAAATTEAIPCLRGKVITEVVSVVTTKTYGVELYRNGDPDQGFVKNLILKNEKMEGGSIFASTRAGTMDDDQRSVQLRIFESDDTEAESSIDEDYFLGEAVLELPPNLPANSLLELSLTLNNQGLLFLHGKDLTMGGEVKATMEASSGTTMSKDEVQAAAKRTSAVAVD